MPVTQNNEQPNSEEMLASEKAIADNILDNFELPESLAKKIDEAKVKEDREISGEKEEPVEDEATEEEQPEPEAKEEAEETEEDKIPKSTFQKRLDEMTREKRLLEARLRKLEEQTPQSRDEDIVKLEKMTESELQSLKKQTRLAQLKNASDETMVTKLMELEDKIEGVMRTAPQRFSQNQISKFNEAVSMSATEIPNFEKAQKDVFQLAKRIYDTAPELHGSVNGQARAWNLAVEHYKLLQEANIGKTKVEELTREKNTLKKKVSVDGGGRKAVNETADIDKLFKKAKNGEAKDKLEFVRKSLNTDAIVEKFLER